MPYAQVRCMIVSGPNKLNFHLIPRPSKRRDGSVGRASDRIARHNTDRGSSPQCSKGFFSQSPLPVQTLLRCPYSPLCVHASTAACTAEVFKRWQPYLNIQKHCTLGSVALAVAVPHLGKVTQIVWTLRKTARADRNGQRRPCCGCASPG